MPKRGKRLMAEQLNRVPSVVRPTVEAVRRLFTHLIDARRLEVRRIVRKAFDLAAYHGSVTTKALP